MPTQVAKDLKEQTEEAYGRLTSQLVGMEAYMERADAPGEWTTREVLSHLLGDDTWEPAAELATFALKDLPLIEIDPGSTSMTEARRRMSLADFVKALDEQRRSVCKFLDTLGDADLERKARIPLFKAFMGTDEITIPVMVGAMLGYHWKDHAGQIAKIRKAVGLPEVK